ncbi:response regulator transcription factor [Smaragdicoccus niigatensis]|uniref:response regulator transcription factor n=1 Tax=Smaragdicoccus niigatensis TaxID=359359 RepID=UPI00037ECE9F|nr:response regulator transcription factor [Smaragdicoccus niigatensis]
MVDTAPKPVVLLVEDDRQLAAMLAGLLTEEGYRVDVARDGQTGLHHGLSGRHDVLILDRGLPVMDGVDLLTKLRGRGVVAPALILTARGSLADRVEGLDAGAEDYLVKPFEIPELLARLRSLLRRHQDRADILQIGRLRLDRRTRTVVDDSGSGAEVELSERECALLSVLAASPGQVFTRTQLLKTVFDSADTSGTVDTYVHYLRRKLGRDIVRTVHGTGYRVGGR